MLHFNGFSSPADALKKLKNCGFVSKLWRQGRNCFNPPKMLSEEGPTSRTVLNTALVWLGPFQAFQIEHTVLTPPTSTWRRLDPAGLINLTKNTQRGEKNHKGTSVPMPSITSPAAQNHPAPAEMDPDLEVTVKQMIWRDPGRAGGAGDVPGRSGLGWGRAEGGWDGKGSFQGRAR